MAQFLTPLGLILSDEGNFEALLPRGAIVAEEVGAGGVVAFNVVQSGAIQPAGVLSVAGDIASASGAVPWNFFQSVIISSPPISGDLSLLPVGLGFGLPDFNVFGAPVAVSGALAVFGTIGYSTVAPTLAEFAQYVLPFGGIYSKEEADEFQPMVPATRGVFVDSAFAFEFAAIPGTNYLTPFGGLLVKLGGRDFQFLHTLEAGVVDDGPLTELYERRTEQYLSPFGFIVEKSDGQNYQELLPRVGFIDNNYEFDAPVLSYDLVQSGVIALYETYAVSGDIFGGIEGPGFEVEGPLVITTFVGTLGVTGDINTVSNPFDVEGPLPITTLQAELALIGDFQYTVDVDQPHNFNQVGAFTTRGVLAISGDVEYTLRPDEPFDISQVGAVALNGVVKVLGQLGTATGFEVLTQPVGIVGVMEVYGPLDFPFPSIIDFRQLGEIAAVGVLAFSDTKFRFDSFTEGLPNGWYVDGPILETVPNPNYGTAYGNAFFRRWTWKGYDPAGTQVAASGSEQDCIAQTLSVCQSRHQEDWHTLSR